MQILQPHLRPCVQNSAGGGRPSVFPQAQVILTLQLEKLKAIVLRGGTFVFTVLVLKLHSAPKVPGEPWLVWLSGLSAGLRTKGSLV